MKQVIILIILIFTLFSGVVSVYSQSKIDSLVEKTLAFNLHKSTHYHWEKNINIDLSSINDSTAIKQIKESIKNLNQLCKKIKITTENKNPLNFEIIIVDSENYKLYTSLVGPKERNNIHKWNYTNDTISNYKLILNLYNIPKNLHQNFITNQIAYALYPNILDFIFIFNKGREEISINSTVFYSIGTTDSNKIFKLKKDIPNNRISPFDKHLIKTLYLISFSSLQEEISSKSNQTKTWLKKNIFFILFPFYILLLVISYYLLKVFYLKLKIKKDNPFIIFNAISLFSLIALCSISSVYFIICSEIKNPYLFFYQWIDVITINLISVISFLLIANLIRFIEKKTNRLDTNYLKKSIISFTITCSVPIVIVLIPYLSLLLFSKTIPNNIQKEQLIQTIINISFCIIVVGFFRAFIIYFKQKEKTIVLKNKLKIKKLEQINTQAKLNELHAKVNPHFLYNSLNSIAGMVFKNPNETEKIAINLAEFYRYSINKNVSNWTTIEQELEITLAYLNIEKVRFIDRLSFNITVKSDIKNYLIPKFILQPLVENAIKHGISKLTKEALIKIKIYQNNNNIILKISDNGAPFPSDIQQGFGIKSIYSKLDILYPKQYQIVFKNIPSKEIEISIPMYEEI